MSWRNETSWLRLSTNCALGTIRSTDHLGAIALSAFFKNSLRQSRRLWIRGEHLEEEWHSQYRESQSESFEQLGPKEPFIASDEHEEQEFRRNRNGKSRPDHWLFGTHACILLEIPRRYRSSRNSIN